MKQTIPAMLILYLLSACATPGAHVIGQDSSLSHLRQFRGHLNNSGDTILKIEFCEFRGHHTE